jgi:hypothetical protein
MIKLVDRCSFLEVEVDRINKCSSFDLKKKIIRRLNFSEIGAILGHPDTMAHQRRRTYFEEHYGDKAQVYGIFDHGSKIISWRLFKPSRLDFWNWARLEVGESIWIGFGAFTTPANRGQHLQQHLLLAAAEDLWKLGGRRIVNYIDMKNAAARQAHFRAGMRLQGRVSAVHLPLKLKAIRRNNDVVLGRYWREKRFVYHIT